MTRNKLPDILLKVLNQLNSQGYCHVLVGEWVFEGEGECVGEEVLVRPCWCEGAASPAHTDDVNALNLKVTPPLPHPPTVKDYDVPIFSCDVQNLSDLEWDLGIQQVSVCSTTSLECILLYFCVFCVDHSSYRWV